MFKSKDAEYVRVGLFVFITLAIAMFVIFMIGSDKQVFHAQYTLKGTFADISGLRIGAPVQLAGVNVGFVDNIRFPKDLLKKKIEVSMQIAKKYQERIREDSMATINTQGLLGDKYIFISVGTPDTAELQDGSAINTKEVVGLFDLAEKGGSILDDLSSAARGLSDFFSTAEGDKGDVKSIVKSVKNIMQETEKGKGLLHALIYDPADEEIRNINEVVANLNEITTKINNGQGTIGALIDDPSIYNEIRSLFGKANRNSLFKTVVRATLNENEKEALTGN